MQVGFDLSVASTHWDHRSYRRSRFDSIWLQLKWEAGGNAFVWFIRICSIPIARSITRWRSWLYWPSSPKLAPTMPDFGVANSVKDNRIGRGVWMVAVAAAYRICYPSMSYWSDMRVRVTSSRHSYVGGREFHRRATVSHTVATQWVWK